MPGAPARIVRIRPDWPPGSNLRLLAQRAGQLHRFAAQLRAAAEGREADGGQPRFLPRPASPQGQMLTLLQQLADAARSLPHLSELAAVLGYPGDEAYMVRSLLEMMESRRLLRLVVPRNNSDTRIDAIRLFDGRTLARAGLAKAKEPA